MNKLMMVLVIAMMACGVEQVDQRTRDGSSLAQNANPNHNSREGGATFEEAQPCELTIDCEVGVCDQDAGLCIGDNSWRTEQEEAHPHR